MMMVMVMVLTMMTMVMVMPNIAVVMIPSAAMFGRAFVLNDPVGSYEIAEFKIWL